MEQIKILRISNAAKLYQKNYLKNYIKELICLLYPLISIIVSFLILNSHNSFNYNRTKLSTFLSGIFFIILSQISVNFISDKLFMNFIILSILPLLLILLYYLFNYKMKMSS